MKKVVLLIAVIFISCATQNRNNGVTTVDKDPKDAIQKDEIINSGWNDNDTYTVNVTGENITKARQNARFKILKDIVNVRMRNQSKYTDIEKITNEFDNLFNNARIIKQMDHSESIEIFYQIKEPGLKSKFERK